MVSWPRRGTSGRTWQWATVVVGSLGLLSCATEPACGCSEPGAFVVVYGTVVEHATLTPVSGAAVTVILAEAVGAGGGCTLPAQPEPDNPAPATTNALGRYRIPVLSTARVRRCLVVDAGLAPVGAGNRQVTVDFGRPGATDSVRVDVEFAGR